MQQFQSKTSRVLIGIFVGAIIISFTLTGFSDFGSNPNHIAEVDGTPITVREYQSTLNAQIERYAQLFGGNITPQQIKSFRLRETTLQQLIQRTVVKNLGEDIGLTISKDELKKEIKKLPYFLTNKQFDVNKYKSLLAANGYSPSSFEETIAKDLISQKTNLLFSSIPVSKESALLMEKMKGIGSQVHFIEFEKEKNTKYLTVSGTELSAFVKDEKNQPLLKSLFENAKSEFTKPERVRASHILIKVDDKTSDAVAKKRIEKIAKEVNSRNFATLAGKYSEGPTKTKGGSLGWFTRGKMVPEFDKVAFTAKKGSISRPVKTQFGYHLIYIEDKEKGSSRSFASVKTILAKRHLQKTKRSELGQFNEKLKNDLREALKSSNMNKVTELNQKYSLGLVKNASLTLYEGSVNGKKAHDEALKFVRDQKKGAVSIEDGPTKVQIIKVLTPLAVTTQGGADNLVSKFSQNLTRTFSSELTEKLQKEAKVISRTDLL